MKIAFGFLCVAALALFFSCKTGPEQKIMGAWKCENVEITNMEDLIKSNISEVPDSLKDSTITEMRKQISQIGEGMKKANIVINYLEEGKYEYEMDGQKQTGTWSITEDGKKITTKVDKEETTSSVIEANEQNLVMEVTGDDGMKIKISYTKNK